MSKERIELTMTSLCGEIHEMLDTADDGMSWEEVEKLHLLLSTYDKLCKFSRHTGMDDEYAYVYEKIDKILDEESTPYTWAQYKDKPDGLMSIISMEIDEMHKAYEGMKANPPTASHADLIREMTHSAAALIQGIEKMTCDK